MKGIILHGGQGTRLRPLTHTGPKQLIKVAGKPISQWALEKLKAAGIKEVGIILGENSPQKVIDYYKDGQEFGMKITYFYQGKARGIAEAVYRTKDFVGNDPFIVFLGDNIILDDLSLLRDGNSDASILLAKVNNPKQFGVAIIKDNKIEKLVEKPKEQISDLALVGVYYFTKVIFDSIEALKPSKRGELEITEAIQNLIDSGRTVRYSIVEGWWKDTGNPSDILEANMKLLDRYIAESTGGDIENSNILGRVRIGRNTKVVNSRIIGPTHIGDNVKLEGCVIGSYTSIGDGSNIRDSQISFSMILDDVNIENVNISSSIIGNNSRVIKANKVGLGNELILGENSSVQIR